MVRLPVRRSAAPAAHALDSPASPAGRRVLEGLRVLVVDDEEDGREMLAILLRSHGASVVTAASAEGALACLGRESPALMISDIGMPHADGYQLMRRIRQSTLEPWHDIPAVALTAFARAEDAAKARDAGFHAHLAKPVEPVRLVASIVELIGGHH